jgi:hypothetical protein
VTESRGRWSSTVAAMVAGSGARSSGEGTHTSGEASGLGFQDGRTLLRDVPTRPDADPGRNVVRRCGNAGSAQWMRASGSDTRRARISVAPRSAGLPREGAMPREARGRLRCRGWQAPHSAARARARLVSGPVRRRGATTTNSTSPVLKGKTPKS